MMPSTSETTTVTSNIRITSTHTHKISHLALNLFHRRIIWMQTLIAHYAVARAIAALWTRPLTPPHARRVIPTKYKQALVAQPEVTFNRRHLTSAINAIISVGTIVPQDRAPEVPELLYGSFSNCWVCTQVIHALLQCLRLTYVDMNLHTDVERQCNACTNMRRLINRYISPGHLLRSVNLHVAEILCRPIHTGTGILSAI